MSNSNSPGQQASASASNSGAGGSGKCGGSSGRTMSRFRGQANSPKKYQVVVVRSCVGPTGLEVYSGLPFVGAGDRGDTVKI